MLIFYFDDNMPFLTTPFFLVSQVHKISVFSDTYSTYLGVNRGVLTRENDGDVCLQIQKLNEAFQTTSPIFLYTFQ